jgi:predicted DNA-binding protein YlxM (UPF0122 family)
MSRVHYGISFTDYQQPRWQKYYEEAVDGCLMKEITKEANVSKEQVYKLLELLYEYRIIN